MAETTLSKKCGLLMVPPPPVTPTPEDVWQLALQFREYDHLFSHVTYDVRQRKGAPRATPGDWS
jgi:hypothetical protein